MQTLKGKIYIAGFTPNAHWKFNDMVYCLLKLRSVTLCLVTVSNVENNVHYRICNVTFPFFEFYWEGKLQLNVAISVLPVGRHNG